VKLGAFLTLVDGVEERITVLTGKEALAAVKQDGYALQYVKKQSEAVCLEAVKQNGDALRYVDKNIFEK